MDTKMTDSQQKLLFVMVTDENCDRNAGAFQTNSSFRYSRSVLQSALQLMGCKPRHAFKISKRVFEVLKTQSVMNGDYMPQDTGNDLPPPTEEKDIDSDSKSFQWYKQRTTLTVQRDRFLDVICHVLSEYKYVGPNQRADVKLACRIRERKESMTILLCGTSGCGKSTLSALLASRLGITTVVSTDSIRHMMRGFTDEKESPLLFASTYHAGECLDPLAVAEAKAKKKVKKLAGNIVNGQTLNQGNEIGQGKSVATIAAKAQISDASANTVQESVSSKVMVVEGYKAQSEMVMDSLDRLITSWEAKKESVVVEGVHLSLSFVMGLMKKHPSIIPFMIYISSEQKHLERFAVRAKYMTLDPSKNKYAKYIRNIRAIQEYLCKRADKHLVPKVNNNNVDKSVAEIHATVFSCLRRRDAGEQLYDKATNTAKVVEEEYRNQRVANSFSSDCMFELIQQKGGSPHVMALVNTDGSVAKAWPVEANSANGTYGENPADSSFGNPLCGPADTGNAECVNLQFGNFGLSAWPTDMGATSYASSMDGSRIDGIETSSYHYSSCCSTPRYSEGRSTKEHAEDISLSSSDEEPDDIADVDSDTDDDSSKTNEVEMEGSVNDGSGGSDEEYEDWALDDRDHAYLYSHKQGKENMDTNSIEVGFKCISMDFTPYEKNHQNYFQHRDSHCQEFVPQFFSRARFKSPGWKI